MKKLLLVLLVTLFFAVPSAFGAWTCTAVVDIDEQWYIKQRVFKVKLACNSDGADPAEFNLSSLLSSGGMNVAIRGAALYRIITDQGTTAPDTYTVSFDDEYGADLTSVTTTSTSQAERFDGGSEIVWDIQIDFGDVGDNGDDVVIYFLMVK